LPHVQFRETENSWRLDSSHRGGHPRDIPCLVDASDVRTVNALNTPSGVVNACNRDLDEAAGDLTQNPARRDFSAIAIITSRAL